MKPHLILFATLLLTPLAALHAQETPRWILPEPDAPRVQRVLFDSQTAGEQVSCYVFTPQPYDTDKEGRFPVLYWLHGSGGSSPGAVAQVARRYGEAMRAGKIPPMILVFPNGLPRGMWCDWKDGSVKLETMFIGELMPYIDHTFRTLATREGRIIEGFSMGGFGAARLGFNHPHLFAAVSLLGAGPLQAELTETPRAGPRERDRLLATVYGGDMAYYRLQSPWHIVAQNAEKLRAGLLIRQVVGDRDETFGFNREFQQHLESLEIPLSFHQLPDVPHDPNLVLNALGEDNWKFYRSALKPALEPAIEPASETLQTSPHQDTGNDAGEDFSDSARSQPPRLIPNPGSTEDYGRAKRTCSGVASMTITHGGRLWVSWYVGTTPGAKIETCPNAYVVVCTSGDGGTTWKEVLAVDPDGPGRFKAVDPRPWIDPAGRLWIIWHNTINGVSYQHQNKKAWAITADDAEQENPTWSQPRQIAGGVLINQPVVLANGDWLFAAHDRKTVETGLLKGVVSEDQGRTFKVRGQVEVSHDMHAIEPMPVERKDGSLWMLVRTGNAGDLNTPQGIAESFSTDQGVTWSPPQPSAIRHTASRFHISRLQSGNLMLVKHCAIDVDLAKVGGRQRRELTAFISKDDGRTWSQGLVIDERVGCTYPDAQQATDGTIYLTWDFKRSKDQKILMTTFREEDVLSASDAAVARVKSNRKVVSQGGIPE
jgi:enterochelin esterase-like enzyme